VLVDRTGEQKGVLEVGGDGEVKGLDVLEGEWKIEKVG
jgi:alpha-D-xyloside xylohydrolase